MFKTVSVTPLAIENSFTRRLKHFVSYFARTMLFTVVESTFHVLTEMLVSVTVLDCIYVLHELTARILPCAGSALSCTASLQKCKVDVVQREE